MDWYRCWYSSIVIIHTSDYESLQNQKGVRCVNSFNDLDCKWNVPVVSSDLVIIGTVIIGTNVTGFALNVTLLLVKLSYDKLQSSTIKTSFS